MSSDANDLESRDYVLAAVDDIFFTTRLRAAANDTDVVLDFASSEEELETRMGRRSPRLVLVDLNGEGFDGIEAVRAIRETLGDDVPVVGFFRHVDTDLKEEALDAGADDVLARRAFVQQIPDLLEGSTDVAPSRDI